MVQAAQFIARTQEIPTGYTLKASEACLNSKDYVKNVERRLGRLSNLNATPPFITRLKVLSLLIFALLWRITLKMC